MTGRRSALLRFLPARRLPLLALAVVALALTFGQVLAPTGEIAEAQETKRCPTAINDHEKHAKLLADCRLLLNYILPALTLTDKAGNSLADQLESTFPDAELETPEASKVLNWNKQTPFKKWKGVQTGYVRGHLRVTGLWLPSGLNDDGRYLIGYLAREIGQLDAVSRINFANQRLFGPIPASFGKLKLTHLLLQNNRLRAVNKDHLLPTFEHPELMIRLRLTPNGYDATTDDNLPKTQYEQRHPFDFTDSNGKVHRACLPAIWLDDDDSNDELTKQSKKNIMGASAYRKAMDGDPSTNGTLRFIPCE